jgi:hypothetical protein
VSEENAPLAEDAVPAGREEPAPARDRLSRLESAAKIVAGISVPILGVAVTFILGTQSERQREDQFRASMTAEREKADSDIRAKMFDFLLSRYFSAEQKASTNNAEDFRTRLMVLRLLLENFQEHFSSRALFAHLYHQLARAEEKASAQDKDEWRKLKSELIDVGRNTASEQLTSLAPVSVRVSDVFAPLERVIDPNLDDQSNQAIETSSLRIPLYSLRGLTGGELFFQRADDSGWSKEGGDSNETDRYSITLVVKQLREDAATVAIWLYKDKYVNNQLQPGESERLSNFTFDASFFSTPYLDNTLLPSGKRFAVIYKGCMDSIEKDFECRFPMRKGRQPMAQFDVVIFESGFLNRRDRPNVEEMLRKGRNDKSWWNFL